MSVSVRMGVLHEGPCEQEVGKAFHFFQWRRDFSFLPNPLNSSSTLPLILLCTPPPPFDLHPRPPPDLTPPCDPPPFRTSWTSPTQAEKEIPGLVTTVRPSISQTVCAWNNGGYTDKWYFLPPSRRAINYSACCYGLPVHDTLTESKFRDAYVWNWVISHQCRQAKEGNICRRITPIHSILRKDPFGVKKKKMGARISCKHLHALLWKAPLHRL